MVYLTILIYIKKGKHKTFNQYESKVLPLLKKHNCRLLLRLKANRHTGSYAPDKIHVISYKSKSDFDKYISDSERKKYSKLLAETVEKTIIIKGRKLL
jgi:uncharacterized protein (DUF1330 family)